MDFKTEIKKMSGTNVDACFHCGGCTSGCQFSELMDFRPNQVNRLVQLGMKDQVLKSSAIWTCVGCNTCSVECPQAVDIPAIMDGLRQMSIRENVKVEDPSAKIFHEQFLNTVKHYGRSHKLEIMMRYKVMKLDLFSDLEVGTKMLLKRKLDILPHMTRNRADLKKIFKKVA